MPVRHVATLAIAPCQYIDYTMDMAAEQKTRTFQMRVDDAWLATVDEWRRKQPDLPARAEAIRRLVDQSLKAGSKDPA